MLLLKEFYLEIREKKGVENLIVDHLSRLPDEVHRHDNEDIKEDFADEELFMITSRVTPWYADIINFLINGYVPPYFNSQQRKRFFHMYNSYFWD